MTADLRAALEAALPDMTDDQAHAARTLIAALTPVTPPMEEPKWPGAPVIAGCHPGGVPGLHVRQNYGSHPGWECDFCSAPWRNLADPRPLTPEEYAEHRIPMPCTHEMNNERKETQ